MKGRLDLEGAYASAGRLVDHSFRGYCWYCGRAMGAMTKGQWKSRIKFRMRRVTAKNWKIISTMIVIEGTMVIRAIITYGLSWAGDYIPRLSARARASSRYAFFIACLRSRKLPLTETLSARAEPTAGIGTWRHRNWENNRARCTISICVSLIAELNYCNPYQIL